MLTPLVRTATTVDAGQERLVFPRQALDEATRGRLIRLRGLDDGEAAGSAALVSSIERHLDRLQRGVDQLRSEADSYPFPLLGGVRGSSGPEAGAPEPRPPAAA